ncbi:protein of unknown function DUF4706 [Trinorchestia longiramus]|nr:protein of unknown function DUF4706 [Trinorchestia longiramus]
MATMVLQMSNASSVLSTPPPTPPMENPSNHPPVHQKKATASASTSSSLKNATVRAEAMSEVKAIGNSSEQPLTSQTKTSAGSDSQASSNTPQNAQDLKVASPTITEASNARVSVKDTNNPKVNRSIQSGRGKTRSSVSATPKSLSNPEEYFRGVSPMCRRLLDDMATVRESMGQDWASLTYEQQCKILDQAIVDEATVRRYEQEDGCSGPDCEYFPKLQLHTGQNIVRDEKLSERGYTCSWRDEHSAPFSWHTRSQMDLTLDTPPETPLEPPSLPADLQEQNPDEARTTFLKNGGDGPSNSSSFTSRPQKRPYHSRRTKSAFSWHYEPSPKPSKSSSQEIPDIILDSKSKITKSNHAAHVVVRADNEVSNAGFMDKLRGVFCKLTTSCLPTQNSSGPVTHSIQGTSSTPPDLRPPHVLAQGTAVQRKNVTTPITLPIRSTSTLDDKAQDSTSVNEIHDHRSRDTNISEVDGPQSNGADACTFNNNNTSLSPSTSQGVVTSPSLSTTNITTNPLQDNSASLCTSDNGNKPTSFARPTHKRRAPDPIKKSAPQPQVENSTSILNDLNTEHNAAENNLNLLNATSKKKALTPIRDEILDNDPMTRPFSNKRDLSLEDSVKDDVPIVDLSTSGQVLAL